MIENSNYAQKFLQVLTEVCLTPGQENGAKNTCSLSNKYGSTQTTNYSILIVQATTPPQTCPWFHLIFQRPFPTDISFLHLRWQRCCFTW